MILLTLTALLMADPPARGSAASGDAVVVSALTTEQLVAQCRGKDADPTPDFCTGYILGAFDTLSRSARSARHRRGPRRSRFSRPSANIYARAGRLRPAHPRSLSATPCSARIPANASNRVRGAARRRRHAASR